MVEISRAIGGQTDLALILELVAKRGRALVSARALVIELHVDGGLEVVAAAGEVPARLVGQQMALEGSVAEAALRTGGTQRLADELNRARFNEHGLGRLGFDAEDGLIVPLVFRGQSLGVLVALDHTCRRAAVYRPGRAAVGGVRHERRDRGLDGSVGRDRAAAPAARGR